jgi:hypothetical protein
MKQTLIIWFILSVSLLGRDRIVNKDIYERYKKLCAQIEWSIKSDHEYYMTDLPKSYGSQSIRDANYDLYKVLIHLPVEEKKLLTSGKKLLRAVKKSQIKKIYTLPEKKEKSRITYYSFSSVN